MGKRVSVLAKALTTGALVFAFHMPVQAQDISLGGLGNISIGLGGSNPSVGVSLGGADGVNAGVGLGLGGGGADASVSASIGGSNGIGADVGAGTSGVSASVGVGGIGADVGLSPSSGLSLGITGLGGAAGAPGAPGASGGPGAPGGSGTPGIATPGLGNNGGNSGVAGRVFAGMSPSELRRFRTQCIQVTSNPFGFDRNLVALCRMIQQAAALN